MATSEIKCADVDVDVVVVGAGFAGMYLLHRLRTMGLSTTVIETGDDVGGTWYWNRYPGARCDIQSVDYSYSFDRELDETWVWSEKYASQPEILRYACHVADKHDLRRDIQFGARVDSAEWDDDSARWQLHLSNGDSVTCHYYVMATGCLSVPKDVDIVGTDRFAGDVYFTSRWPHDGVDLTGKRVGVIGTGSSAIQSIPIMAAQAAQLTVFQRTPNFSIPANNGPIPGAKQAAISADRGAYRDAARWTSGGVPFVVSETSALAVSDEERLASYEHAWQTGGIMEFLGSFNDHLVNPVANELLCEFVRNKIRSTVSDPETAEALCPTTFPIGAKRLCVDTNYYETYNRPNVRLVDLHAHPIGTITETGIDLVDVSAAPSESIELDVIVFATGFDAMTGAVVGVDITGRAGVTLKQTWQDGPMTYLGLMVAGFPNFFMVTGPGSPSVLSNMMVSIEQHVDWITDTIGALNERGIAAIEPTETAVQGWVQHVNDYADLTLMKQANSWYMGANVPGKPRVFLPYAGGVERYRRACNEVIANEYLGFELRGTDGTTANDGVIRRLQPDVAIMLEMMGMLEIPTMDSMSATDARAFSDAMAADRPAGPEVGEIVDGTLPGAAGDLRYRLYRPSSAGPHPVVVYFHGGGWVLGSEVSDDPFCRDLCARSDALIVSVDYRHAPEARFPAAADDAFAATRWIAANAGDLGGIPGQLAVAGWSAGANLAAVVCQLARDNGGPAISGQLLLTPVTDGVESAPSHEENADGYMLTKALMTWFWDHYADPADRADPKASPLRAESLASLPPAFVVTSEFDPLRDEGTAYAEAMAAAGVDVHHLRARGHLHTSITAVDVMLSGAPIRSQMADGLRGFFARSSVTA